MNLKDKYNQTPLHYACMKGYVDIVKILIEKNADLNVKNKYNNTPLHIACMRGYVDIVKLLIKNKVIVNYIIYNYNSIKNLLNYNINLKYCDKQPTEKKELVKNFEEYYKINITNNKNEFYNVNCCHFMI